MDSGIWKNVGLVSILAAVAGISAELGAYTRYGLQHFTAFSLAEHLVGAISMAPRLVATSFCGFMVVAIYGRRLFPAQRTTTTEAVGHNRFSESIRKTFYPGFIAILPAVVLLCLMYAGTNLQSRPVIFAIAIVAASVTGLCAYYAWTRENHFAFPTAAFGFCIFTFIVGSMAAIATLESPLTHKIKIKDGGNVEGVILGVGERGFLIFNKEERRIYLIPTANADLFTSTQLKP